MDKKTGRGVSAGGGQSSLGYLFGSGEAPKPTNGSTPSVDKSAPTPQSPAVDVSKQIPAGIQGSQTNNYHRAEGQNTGNFLTVLLIHIYSYYLFTEPYHPRS
jgi:protein SPIRAL1 and related proteins